MTTNERAIDALIRETAARAERAAKQAHDDATHEIAARLVHAEELVDELRAALYSCHERERKERAETAAMVALHEQERTAHDQALVELRAKYERAVEDATSRGAALDQALVELTTLRAEKAAARRAARKAGQQ